MELVTVKQKRFADYLPFLDPPVREEIEELAARLQGKKVAMINATTFGGGVAEKLHSLVPLIKDLGIHLDWWVFEGSLEFYQVTKVLHNRLQGQEGSMTPQEVEIFDQYNRANAATMANWDYDLVVVHDPQPAALIHYRQDLGRTKWIWRCHIDTSTPNEECWDFICQYIRQYDATIFTMPDFVKEGSRLNRLTFITPSIDPLSRKNILLDPEEARKIVARFGVDTNRPLITQVSRFDPWKDPLG